ncbi:class II aldolase/adducin family protein [Thermodesulfobacteriota bacterium]
MVEQRISKEVFCRYCRQLYESRLVAGVGGNLTVRSGGVIMATPSGYSLRDLSSENVVLLDGQGKPTTGGVPTKDIEMHRGILAGRSDVRAICHVHGPYIIALSTLLEPGPDTLPPLTPGFVYYAHPLAMIPFLVPGSPELARVASEHFENPDCRALMLQNHGLITVGKDFHEALNIAEEVDEAARIYVLTGGRAVTIPEESLEKIKKL